MFVSNGLQETPLQRELSKSTRESQRSRTLGRKRKAMREFSNGNLEDDPNFTILDSDGDMGTPRKRRCGQASSLVATDCCTYSAAGGY